MFNFLKNSKEMPKNNGEIKTVFSIKQSTEVVSLPDVVDKTQLDVTYPLIEPYAYAHIFWDKENHELVYYLEEPKLDEQERSILTLIEDGLRELINISFINIKDQQIVIEYLEKNVRILLNELHITVSDDAFLKFMYYIYRDFVGLNEIEPLMQDYFIEDIECNGSKTPIFIVHRKYRNLRTNITYPDNKVLASFVEKLAQKAGKYVSYSNPLLDGSLPGGSRVNATYTTDVSSRGPTFCFANGYLQLSNGEVIDIEEFFNSCKKNFKTEIEDGNEIIKIETMGCCGVDENNLSQTNAKLNTVIKLKPPNKLVDIKLEDGSEITTTTNHLFHVAFDSLRLIKAEDLLTGMFIPVPAKISIEGCHQNLSIANLLKEFSYYHKVCLVSNGEVKNLVSNKIINYTANTGSYRRQMSLDFDVHNSYFYEILSRGSSISFEVFENIGGNVEAINDLQLVVYGGGRKNKAKNIKVPSELDEDLAYLAGALISDGHVSRGSIDFACYEEGFRGAVMSRLMKKFGKCELYYDGNRVYLSNLFVPFFFNKIFGIPYGKKSNIVEVPQIIFKSNNKIVASFIRGLFDGDGTCKSGLSYKTSSKRLAEQLSYLLARLGIYSYLNNKALYKVTIPSIYERVYMDKIGFENKIKNFDLINLLNKKDDVKSYIRHGRIPAKPVLNLMKEAGLSKNKISQLCNISYARMYYDSFSKKFVEKLIPLLENRVDDKKLDYVKWLISCDQEFVRVVSVKFYENLDKKPVYDIELEPCKFFIAGNKPINVFDTIRKFTKEPWTPVKLIDFRTVSPEIMAYLWLAIEYESNIMVIGGTGTGKTSFLNAISFFIPPAARVVSIEDTKELSLMQENWLPTVAREGTGLANIMGQKHGEVSLFDLLKESFRQRPDYVIVGEIRGKEAYVLFQGMSSGHPSFGTMHAEDVNTMVRRLETEPINLSPSLVESLDIVCVMAQAKVGGADVRRIREIVEIISVKEQLGRIETNTPFVRDPATDKFFFKTNSYVFDKISKRHGINKNMLLREFQLRSGLLFQLYKNKIFGFKEVQDIVNDYYKTPEAVLKRFGIV